jgi:6-phosphofructokinase 1
MNTADLSGITSEDLAITRLGERHVDAPLRELLGGREESMHYVTETDRVLLDDTLGMAKRRQVAAADLPAFNPGGPREKLYFEPSAVTAAIVTCGGLCPGLNNVVRGLFLQLCNAYGAKSVLGFRNGYQGWPTVRSRWP